MNYRLVKVNKSIKAGELVLENFITKETKMSRLKFEVKSCYFQSSQTKEYFIQLVHSKAKYFYLWHDGTINHTATNGWWGTKKEAQEFLDKWIPKEFWLTDKKVYEESQKSEREALDCSIEHWKQIVLDVDNGQHHTGSMTCAMCQRYLCTSESCESCPVNNYKKYKNENYRNQCCKEYSDFIKNKNLGSAIAMLNKLVVLRNKMYGNPYLETKPMVKEMTVGEISKVLGYDVKVVKEEPVKKEEVYQFKAGDVIEDDGDCGYRQCIIVREGKKLLKVDLSGLVVDSTETNYWLFGRMKKIGELKDYIN